jgi:hypothetical protein
LEARSPSSKFFFKLLLILLADEEMYVKQNCAKFWLLLYMIFFTERDHGLSSKDEIHAVGLKLLVDLW